MKKIIVLFFLFLAVNLYSQTTGIGFRLGDLSGISFKKYSSAKAFELSLGRTYLFIGDHWYYNHFNYWYKKNKFGYREIDYLNYYRETVPLGLQLHFLSQHTIDKAASEAGKLDWYLGFGGQFRYQSYFFDYRYKVEGDPDWHYVADKHVVDYDLGADGVVGLEYTFSKAPVSVFLDFTLFMEVIDDPFLFNGQTGLGVRYNF
jgi:hypothetical protein